MTSLDLAKIRHVIWDWNGTLLDDAWLCIEITNGLLSARNLETMTPQRYQDLFDFPVRVYYERLGFDLEAESFETLGSAFIDTYDRRRFECSLQPQAREALHAVCAAGLDQSILSAYQKKSLDELVRHLGLRELFTEVIGLDDHYAAGKVEHGKAWMERLDYDPSEVLLVGDTSHDHDVAAEIGAHCVLIPSGHHPLSKLEPCGVPIFESLAAFEQVIGRD
jgi:phosphoglycolate phosphatase